MATKIREIESYIGCPIFCDPWPYVLEYEFKIEYEYAEIAEQPQYDLQIPKSMKGGYLHHLISSMSESNHVPILLTHIPFLLALALPSNFF